MSATIPDPIRAAARTIAAVSSPDCRCTFKRGVLVEMCSLCEAGAERIETAMREATVQFQQQWDALKQWVMSASNCDPLCASDREIILAKIRELETGRTS